MQHPSHLSAALPCLTRISRSSDGSFSAWGLAALLVAMAWSTAAHAADWTRFRGPNGTGIAADSATTATTWSPTENLQWRTALPGMGFSCPIVVGQRVFVTTYSGFGIDRDNPGNMNELKRHVVCLDRNSGQILWDKDVDPFLPEDEFAGYGIPVHGYATQTPVSDGERVYVFFGKTGALAFSLDGNLIWHNNQLGTQSANSNWGSSSSPILVGDVLVIAAGPEARAIFGLNKNTGEVLWKTDTESVRGMNSVWSTPVVSEVNGRTDVVIGVTNEVWGLDPQTGAQNWVCKNIPGWCFNTVFAVTDDMLVAVEGQGGVAIGIRPGGTGDVTATHVAWNESVNNRFCSAVVYDGRVYYIAREVIHCLDAATGRELYEERLQGGTGGAFRKSGDSGLDLSSPVIADGKLYYALRTGDIYVINAESEQFEQLAVNRLTSEDEDFAATPAVSDGQIFFRSKTHLYCVSARN